MLVNGAIDIHLGQYIDDVNNKRLVIPGRLKRNNMPGKFQLYTISNYNRCKKLFLAWQASIFLLVLLTENTNALQSHILQSEWPWGRGGGGGGGGGFLVAASSN